METIYFYPLKISLGWIIGKKGWRINKIKNFTQTEIKLKNNEYFIINGKNQHIHHARIILQDIEKEFHKITYNSKSTMG